MPPKKETAVETVPEEETTSDWKAILLPIVTTLFQQYSTIIAEGIHEKVDQLLTEATKRLIIALLMLIGAVFALVGIAYLINELFNTEPSTGFLVVGGAVLIIGILMNYANKK